MSEQEINTLTPNNMPEAKPAADNAHPAMQGLATLSLAKQIGLMLGLAFSVAMGIAVVLWSQTPSYSLLFASVAEKDAAEILDVLTKLDVDYKIDTGSGAIMVPADDVRELKMKLASQGLPRSDSLGYELLDKEMGFGTSKSVEKVRFQRALEGEIARTITSIQNIKSARVLLALPKQSVFVRKRKKPSASVIVNLYQGRTLEKGHVESIVHLVASSVPLLEAEQVTVVDQKGHLLNSKNSSSDVYLSSKQFEYKKQIEDHLMARIDNILSPVVGMDSMRVQISADVDFTVTEKTQEMFNPDLPALRSEQIQEQQNSSSTTQGVPGALSNQPPPAGIAPEVANGQNSTGGASAPPQSGSKSAVRNFELDKTITHTRMATGILQRLSVAVVVDNQRAYGEDGEIISKVYSQEDINRFTDLVKQAVGFDVKRGDQVTVSNIAFMMPEAMEALPEIPMWEQGWFIDLMKQVGALAIVLLLIFTVLRPAFRGLVSRKAPDQKALADNGPIKYDEKGVPIATPAGAANQANIQEMETEDLLLLEAPQSYEKRLEYVQKLVDEEPKLVAQVIKSWVTDNG